MTLALVAGGVGWAAGSLMQAAFVARVTTSQLRAGPAVAAVSAAALSTDPVPDVVHLTAALSLPAEKPMEPPRPAAVPHASVPRQRSENRPSHPGVLLPVAEGHELAGARSVAQTPALKAPPAPLEALSGSASARGVDLERANPYRQKQ
jgi:hypothetical protein